MSDRKNDGLNHDYVTCPKCGRVSSTENIVTLDGEVMCRRCMQAISEKAEGWPHSPRK
jgi:formylmethanofuran dehydrogenase subunit E